MTALYPTEFKMKSSDSIPYYHHHARRLAEADLKYKNPGELLPFLELLKPGSRVIDLGAGSGVDAHYIEKAGMRVLAIEGAAGRVELARTQYPELTIEQKNLLFLSLKEGEWEGAWANRSLHHFEPELVQRIVSVVFRGLVSRGILGVVVYEGSGMFEDREGDLAGPSRVFHPYTEKALCSMLEQTGFRILRVGRVPADGTHPLPSMMVLAQKI